MQFSIYLQINDELERAFGEQFHQQYINSALAPIVKSEKNDAIVDKMKSYLHDQIYFAILRGIPAVVLTFDDSINGSYFWFFRDNSPIKIGPQSITYRGKSLKVATWTYTPK